MVEVEEVDGEASSVEVVEEAEGAATTDARSIPHLMILYNRLKGLYRDISQHGTQ